MSDDDEKVFLTLDQAIAWLPEGDEVHTYRSSSGVLLGADWGRSAIVAALRVAEVIEKTGSQASAMHHGMAIMNRGSWLFIQTRKGCRRSRRQPGVSVNGGCTSNRAGAIRR